MSERASRVSKGALQFMQGAVLAALLAAGCSPVELTEHSANQIVVGLPLEPLGFYPLRSLDSGSYYAQTLVFEGLLRYDANMRIVPGVCSDYDVSDDGLTYTLKLRSGLRFSDGQPVTIGDVLASIALAQSKFSPYKGDYEAIATVENPDADTIVLHLTKPSTPLLARLVELRLLPKRIIDTPDHGRDALSRHPVGVGPFVLSAWESGLELDFNRNPYYWGEKPQYEKLVWRVIPDKTLAALALRRGELDVAQLDAATWTAMNGRQSRSQANVPENQSESSPGNAGSHEPIEVESFPGTRTVYVGFNTNKTPFSEELVRQAIGLSIDRSQLVKGLYGGYGVVPQSDVPAGNWAYNANVKHWTYDPELAKATLEKAGYQFRDKFWRSAKTGESLAFRILTLRDYQDVASVVADDLRRIGITAEVQIMEYATLRQRYLSKGLFETMVWSRSSGPDPECSLVWGSGGALNYSRFNLPEMDRLIALGKAETDRQARKKIYGKIQSILADELPWVFLVQPELLIAHQSDITNVKQAHQSMTGLPWDNPLFNAAQWRRLKVQRHSD
ncbi:MAG TPA: ABC transporter substrate-binding protein [Chroococcales cyanobacterium]